MCAATEDIAMAAYASPAGSLAATGGVEGSGRYIGETIGVRKCPWEKGSEGNETDLGRLMIIGGSA
jgi:hypothetical protein